MPAIKYTATNFPASVGTALTGTHILPVTWSELIWSAVTVGKPGRSGLLLHGPQSLDEMRFRAYMIWANLSDSGAGIIRSTVYEDLDPSEKGAISYFIGLAIGKLLASRLLFVDCLVHLDRVVHSHSVELVGRSRPDLVGQDRHGRWILLEGKGRSGSHSAAVLAKAKDQVRQVLSINRTTPYLRVAAEACFESHLTAYLDDPAESTPDAVALAFDPHAVTKEYYSKFQRVRGNSDRRIAINRRQFSVATFATLGVAVGIADDAESSIVKGGIKQDENTDTEAADEPAEKEAGWRWKIYKDGILIGLDRRWTDQQMSLSPDRRESAF